MRNTMEAIDFESLSPDELEQAKQHLLGKYAIFGDFDYAATYPTATAEELAAGWEEAFPDDRPLEQTKQVLGVFRRPETQPAVIISADLCEVFRDTHRGIRLLEPERSLEPHREPYAYGMQTITAAWQVHNMVRLLMNADLMQPDPMIANMRGFMQHWRRNGAYIFGNTATSEGCELATARLAESFDGLVFSRNHDGSAPIQKGHVAREVADRIAPEGPLVMIHIDDGAHHLESFKPAFADRPDTTVMTFQPRYKDVRQHHESQGDFDKSLTFHMVDRSIEHALARLSSRDLVQSELS